MARMIEADVRNGEVYVGAIQVNAEILSLGTKDSTGVVILDGTHAKYFASSALDIKDLITALIQIINQVALIATGLDAVTNSPGAQAALITQLQVLKTQLNATKETLI